MQLLVHDELPSIRELLSCHAPTAYSTDSTDSAAASVGTIGTVPAARAGSPGSPRGSRRRIRSAAFPTGQRCSSVGQPQTEPWRGVGVARFKPVMPRKIGCTSMTSAKHQNAVSSSRMSACPETAGTIPCHAARSQHRILCRILWTYKSTLVTISSRTRPPARRASAVRYPVRVLHCRRPTTQQAL